MKLLIGSDLVPTPSNLDFFSKGNVTELLGDELLSLWSTADLRIFNLEVPLTDKETPIKKCGPNLIAPTSTVKGIKALNPTLLTLANNHILDQGEEGLKSTQQILNKYDIPFVGVGENLSEASKPFIITYGSIKIGIYACAEHEFTIATSTSAGANPFDPLESLDHIYNLKEKCDYVIVLYHGGKEHYQYPSPNLQKICRKIVEKGADLIVCQHSHCIGSTEEYNGSTIVYGQGNFLFDDFENDLWNTSLLIQVNIDNGVTVEYIPIVKAGNSVRLANELQREEILYELKKRSAEIKQEGFVEIKYTEFAKEMFDNYLSGLHGNNLFFLVLNKICKRKLTRKLYSPKSLRWVRNIIECEAHRELILKYLSRGERQGVE